MSTKGSNAKSVANPSGEDLVANVMSTMGLYVQGDHCAHLVALGKIYEEGSIIHNVPYADDLVRVSLEKVYDKDSQVPFSTSEIQYVRQTFDTFITWLTHLVKPVSHEVFIFA